VLPHDLSGIPEVLDDAYTVHHVKAARRERCIENVLTPQVTIKLKMREQPASHLDTRR
jgi:hypothetical protein